MADETIQAEPSGDPTPVEAQQNLEESAAAVETAEESIEDLKVRLKEVNDARAKDGREKAALAKTKIGLEAELTQTKKALDAHRADLQQWQKWYIENAATPEERTRLEAQAAQQRTQQTDDRAGWADFWETVAQEEDPKVKKALLRIGNKAKERGERVSISAIEAVREEFSESAPTKEDEVAPRIGGARATGSAPRSIEDEMESARREAKETGDTTSLLNTLSQRAAAGRRS